MTEIENQPIKQFLNDLASKSATPGGGSAAALMGAQGAALVSMVCNLTLGKPKFADVEVELQGVLEKAEDLRASLTQLIQADINIFNQLMARYALPKDTEDEKAARSKEIQAVLKEATEVPLQCARACAEVVALSRIAADLGNPNAVSDAGAAVMAAYGGLKTAALNVYINTGSLKDKEFVDAKLKEIAEITDGVDAQVESIYQTVKNKL